MQLERLILIRHAHREVSDRSQDNGLSSKGKQQARLLHRFFNRRFSPSHSQDLVKADWVLYSSPKLRCVQTLEPWQEGSGLKVEVKEELDEQRPGEVGEDFIERVRDALNFLAAMSPSKNVILCSHGDWLPVAAHILTGCSVELKKGAWLELEPALDQWRLRWLVQKLYD